MVCVCECVICYVRAVCPPCEQSVSGETPVKLFQPNPCLIHFASCFGLTLCQNVSGSTHPLWLLRSVVHTATDARLSTQQVQRWESKIGHTRSKVCHLAPKCHFGKKHGGCGIVPRQGLQIAKTQRTNWNL